MVLAESEASIIYPNGEAWAGGLFLAIPCCGGVLGLLLTAFWIWVLIDCLMRDFPGNDKVVWALVIVLLGPFGALIYLLIGRSRGVRAR